jgi:N,N-dimethylformamidase
MPFRISGYTPTWHVRPGESVPVHASTPLDRYYVRLIRFHSAIGPDASWSISSTQIDVAGLDQPVPGADYPIVRGSHATVRDIGCDEVTGASVGVWLRAEPAAESMLMHFQRSDGDFDVLLNAGGHIVLQVAGEAGRPCGRRESTLTRLRLRPNRWYRVGVLFEQGGSARVIVRDCLTGLAGAAGPVTTCRGTLETLSVGGRRLEAGSAILEGCLDAKIEHLRLWAGRVPAAEELAGDRCGLSQGHWDFAEQPYRDTIRDSADRFPDLALANAPTRAVTSSAWRGQSTDFTADPQLYAAVFLHRDDLADTRWPTAFEVLIPLDATSGVYCLLLSEHREVDYADLSSFYPVPLFVAPPGSAHADVALVLPTFSYRAYANNTKYLDADPALYELKGPTRSAIVYDYCLERQLRSLYCSHPDGSGVHLASVRRPQASVRPDLVSQLHGFPHQLSADLEIVQWLESLGVRYDILTDEILHERGSDALRPYTVALTGTHPEYSTRELLDAYSGYLDLGGRLLYLGGNGFILRVTISDSQPWLQELRRGDNGSIWDDAPGEMRHQMDGGLGGMWRAIGRPPNVLTGLGYAAIGFSGDGDYCVPAEAEVERLPPRLRGAVEAVRGRSFGVAGLELDGYDPLLGSHSDAVVFGSLSTLPPHYVPVDGYVGPLAPDPAGAVAGRLRGNLVFFRTQADGAVASFGSIRWASGLNLPGDPAAVRSLTTAALRDLLSNPRTAPQSAPERAGD